MLYVGALEAAMKGRGWPRDQRGLERAKGEAASKGYTVDPSWFEVDTPMYDVLERKSKKLMHSPQDAEDILGDLLADYAPDIAKSQAKKILSGAMGPRHYRSILLRKLKQIAIDAMRRQKTRWDAHGDAIEVGGVGRTDDEYVQSDAPSTHMFNVQTDLDALISVMRGPTGRVLREWLRELWSGPQFSDAQRAILMYRLDNPTISQKQIADDLGVGKAYVTNVLTKAKKVSREELERDTRMQKFIDDRVELSELGFGGRTAAERVAFRYLVARVIDALCSDW